jgi:hypothetical protein
VPWPAPAEIPFWRITTLSREVESVMPARSRTARCSRGKVQFGRSARGSASSCSIAARAAWLFHGALPGLGRVRSAATPPARNRRRHCRTVSACTPSIWPITAPVRPSLDHKIARARSASARSVERASCSSAARSSSVTERRVRPTMPTSTFGCLIHNTRQTWMIHRIPA